MLQSGKSRSSINPALSAIRKLAADNGLVPPTLAYGVERVKGVKQVGIRAGNWLTKEEAEQLINTPVMRWRQEGLAGAFTQKGTVMNALKKAKT